MTYGLGALQSPPDDRDLSIDELYKARNVPLLETPPASFLTPHIPAVYDQGNTPLCVAFSSSTVKASEDLADLGHNYKWDRSWFFRLIGGTSNGAQPRIALSRMRNYGYPLLPSGSGNSAASHKIAAYYAVPATRLSIQRAVQAFGIVLIGMPWYDSWFNPNANGTLPPANYQVGGHAIAVVGWTSVGLRLQNSWGTAWGVSGRCTLPWAYLGVVWEAWKCVDQVTHP